MLDLRNGIPKNCVIFAIHPVPQRLDVIQAVSCFYIDTNTIVPFEPLATNLPLTAFPKGMYIYLDRKVSLQIPLQLIPDRTAQEKIVKEYIQAGIDENYDAAVVIASCDRGNTKAPKSYKVLDRCVNAIVEMPITGLVGRRLHNAILVKSGTKDAYIRLKHGDLPAYKCSSITQPCVLYNKYYRTRDYGNKELEGLDLTFYRTADNAINAYNERVLSLSRSFTVEDSSMRGNQGKYGGEICGATLKSTREAYDEEILSIIKMDYLDENLQQSVLPTDTAYAVIIDMYVDENMSYQGIMFFRSIQRAQKWYSNRLKPVPKYADWRQEQTKDNMRLTHTYYGTGYHQHVSYQLLRLTPDIYIENRKIGIPMI